MPREVARIQSFPDTYVLDGVEARQYRALGNAIPPVLAWHVMGAVRKALDPEYTPETVTKGQDGKLLGTDSWSARHLEYKTKPTQMLLAVERQKAKVCVRQGKKGLKGMVYSRKPSRKSKLTRKGK